MIPAGALLYFSSQGSGDEKPLLTQLIERFSTPQEVWARASDLHIKAMEQAGRDAILLYSAPRPQHIELRCPE